MRTNYNQIRASVNHISEVRAEIRKYSSLNIGVITGGYDMTELNAEFDAALKTLVSQVHAAIDNGARLSYLREQLDGELCTTRMVDEVIRQRELDRRYQRSGY